MEFEQVKGDRSDRASEPPSLRRKSPRLAACDCTAAAMRRAKTDGPWKRVAAVASKEKIR